MPLCDPAINITDRFHQTSVLVQLVTSIEELKRDVDDVKRMVAYSVEKMDELKTEVSELKRTVPQGIDKSPCNVNEKKRMTTGDTLVQLILRKQVKEYAELGNWSELRMYLEAALDHDTDAYTQLQLIPYTDKFSLWRIGFEGCTALAAMLLHAGLKVNIKDNDGSTLLHAAAAGGYAGLVEMLLDRGADCNVGDNYKNTPIMLAALNNHVRIVKLLKERGADVNSRDSQGRTSLHWAVCRGHIQVVMYLVQSGANITARSFNNETPLDMASDEQQSLMEQYLTQPRPQQAIQRHSLSLTIINNK